MIGHLQQLDAYSTGPPLQYFDFKYDLRTSFDNRVIFVSSRICYHLNPTAQVCSQKAAWLTASKCLTNRTHFLCFLIQTS